MRAAPRAASVSSRKHGSAPPAPAATLPAGTGATAPRVNPPAPAFPRSARLLKPAQFQRVFSNGRRVAVPGFQLHVLPADDGARLGLAVSRRVDRRAVVRNRIKRAARELFRIQRGGLPGADYVLVARREAATMTPAELTAALQALWRRAATLKPAHAAGTMPAAAPAGAPPDSPNA